MDHDLALTSGYHVNKESPWQRSLTKVVCCLRREVNERVIAMLLDLVSMCDNEDGGTRQPNVDEYAERY